MLLLSGFIMHVGFGYVQTFSYSVTMDNSLALFTRKKISASAVILNVLLASLVLSVNLNFLRRKKSCFLAFAS